MNATAIYSAHKKSQSNLEEVEDVLTIEEMLSISINDIAYTITMRTPGDEEAHTRGILLTEDVYINPNKNPVFQVTERNEKEIITKVNVLIPEEELQKGIQQKRNLLSVSSCGICGKFEMDLQLNGTLSNTLPLNGNLIANMYDEMALHQFYFRKTGGCHAASLFTIEGKFLSCKEDIGRHNAVDKVIGELLLQGKLADAKVLLVSGRVSYEIVNKALKAGIPFLCAVSAPSSMAVDYCQQAGITLLAFCRGEKFTVYSHAENIMLL